MLTVPIYIFFFAYFIFLIIFAFFSIVNLAHLFHTGAFTFVSLSVTIIVTIITILIFMATWFLLQNVDWQQTITLFDKAWFTNGSNYF